MKVLSLPECNLKSRFVAFLTRLFTFDEVVWIKPTPVVYLAGGGWGNRIDFVTQPAVIDHIGHKIRFVGWKDRIPDEGDVLLADMESGNTARFVFTLIEPCYDPRDMFFADGVFIGYCESK